MKSNRQKQLLKAAQVTSCKYGPDALTNVVSVLWYV